MMNFTYIGLCFVAIIISYIDSGIASVIPRANYNNTGYYQPTSSTITMKPIEYNQQSTQANLKLTSENGDLQMSSSDGMFVKVEPPTIAFTKRPNVCNDCVCGVGRKSRIVGGTIANVGEFPWMVGVTKLGQFHCGGSLITRRHVLTAAHCLEGYDKRYFEVHIGNHQVAKMSDSSIRRRVKNWTLHEDFNVYNLNNDIAIIELDRAVPLHGNIKTACLPENRAIDYSGALAIAIGWGRITEGGEISSELRQVKVPVLSDEECDEAGYRKSRRTENMFCAGYLEGLRDACSGDSGGPLLVNGPHNHLEIIGITSFGRGCARPRYPGVYTKLTNYLGWLSDELHEECICPPSINDL